MTRTGPANGCWAPVVLVGAGFPLGSVEEEAGAETGSRATGTGGVGTFGLRKRSDGRCGPASSSEDDDAVGVLAVLGTNAGAEGFSDDDERLSETTGGGFTAALADGSRTCAGKGGADAATANTLVTDLRSSSMSAARRAGSSTERSNETSVLSGGGVFLWKRTISTRRGGQKRFSLIIFTHRCQHALPGLK